MNSQQATICALSTGFGGAIALVRLSGSQAHKVAGKVFRPSNPGQDLCRLPGFRGCLGRVFDTEGDFDEAILTLYHAPRSYTGEDMAELSLHGSPYIIQRLLQACIAAGAQPAQAGEFTKRAFLSGKLSLDQAEAVGELIAGQSRQANAAALALKDGRLYREIMAVADTLLAQAAHLAAWVDFPEEEIEELDPGNMLRQLQTADGALATLQAGYHQGKLLRHGVDTVIAGRPNVGKSSLMNLLAGTSRSIVTEIAGTTRDVVEETVTLGEVTLRLADTAGLRTGGDAIEQLGMQATRKRLEQAQLVLAVFDASQPLTEQDSTLAQSLAGKPALALLNKCDLPMQADGGTLSTIFPKVVEISAQTGQGLQELQQAVQQLLGLAGVDASAPMLANARQLDCLLRSRAALADALQALQAGSTLDAVSVCLDSAIAALLELVGKRVTATVVDKVFETFCVGK